MHPRLRRSSHIFVLIAALLVAALLVGSTLWTIYNIHHPAGSNAHTKQASQTPAPTYAPTPMLTATAITPAIAPSTRVNSQLIYDNAMNMLLLFSGVDYSGAPPPIDTWAWDGSTWIQLHPAHTPQSRTDAAIAYDPNTQQVVLFGGMNNVGGTKLLGDTWIWNGSDWTQQQPVNSPSTRIDANLAYDASTKQLILFGGKDVAGFTPSRNDTWIWTGSNWVQQHPDTVPPARSQASMVYDRANKNLVLFGGGDPGSMFNDTWIWNGSNWVQQHPKTVPALSSHLQGQVVTFHSPSMVYNSDAGKLMLTLVGQGENNGIKPDYWTQASWSWDGSDWTQLNTTGPSVMAGTMFYSAQMHTVFEFTSLLPYRSSVIENGLWRWDGQEWVLIERW